MFKLLSYFLIPFLSLNKLILVKMFTKVNSKFLYYGNVILSFAYYDFVFIIPQAFYVTSNLTNMKFFYYRFIFIITRK